MSSPNSSSFIHPYQSSHAFKKLPKPPPPPPPDQAPTPPIHKQQPITIMHSSDNNSSSTRSTSPIYIHSSHKHLDPSNQNDNHHHHQHHNNHHMGIRLSVSPASVKSSPQTGHQLLKSTSMRESTSNNSNLSIEDIKCYYIKLINYEFRNLQLDIDLQSKSLFDLIDYCELLYENSNNDGIENNLNNLKSYIKGFLIFNYFINGFIMFHFEGFDSFIESNEQDFIIYLNIFAFYNTDQIFNNGNYTINSIDIRTYIKNYLFDKNLLSFDIDELYDWLNQYINYLKEKDMSYDNQDNEDDSDNEFSFENYNKSENSDELDEMSNLKIDYTSNSQRSKPPHSRNSSIGSIDGFKNRYPSLNVPRDFSKENNHSILSSSTSTELKRKAPPPIPTSLPPSLTNKSSASPKNNTHSLSPPKNHIPKLSPTPYPEKDIVITTKLNSDGLYFTTPSTNGNHNNNDHQTSTYRRQTEPIVESNVSHPHDLNGHSSENHYNPYHHQPLPHPHTYQYSPAPNFPPPQQPNHYYQNNGQPFMYPSQYSQHPHNHHLSPQTYPQYQNQNNHHPIIPNHVMIQQEQIKSQKFNMLKDLSVCGLRNFGSSCYINSTIQLLFGIYQFKLIFNKNYQRFVKNPKFIKIMQNSNSHKKDSILLSEAINGLLKTMQQNGGVPISPTKFIRVTSLLKPDFNIPHEQQDSQEFLLFILERLHEELNDNHQMEFNPEYLISKWAILIDIENEKSYKNWLKSLYENEGSSPISDLIQGHLQNKLKCNKCHYESISYSPFSILSLPIPKQQFPNEIIDLSSCLSYYIQDEILSGDNAWRCPKCHGEVPSIDNHPVFEKKKGLFKLNKSKNNQKNSSSSSAPANNPSITSTKSISFVKLPQILFIHLSRFSMYNLTDKLNTAIRYPLKLIFNNFKFKHEIKYKLCGIINHFGNLKSGHYTSIINKSNLNEDQKNLSNLIHPFWCLFDDENVKPNINNGSLRDDNSDGGHYEEMISKDVYVLCYERID
ncbi:uncharacterized protein KGF55_001155 [Candida pseudojiufengensis]|uniref:uncharacterized protein n=1 Tax=Candida pseudojiufengensis TaxID=497109 RepID=UPI002224E69E|nr:uncharacterized protein KGF55_001155 [Candida pseudojiufengensis]KAI5965792.1 hypothetical protein KGF55_001155 [Candida pseudojiufengensis]